MPWSVAFMVVMIVMIVTIGRVSREKHRAIGRAGHPPQPVFGADNPAQGEEIKQLRERIQVLERVITDQHGGSADLERQIERLRDR
ncbi:hypothetical protein [Sphingomonas corticis]